MYIHNLQIGRQNNRERTTVPFTTVLESNGRDLTLGANKKINGYYIKPFQEFLTTSTDTALGQGDALLSSTVDNLKIFITSERFDRTDNPVLVFGLFGTEDIDKYFTFTGKTPGHYSWDRYTHGKKHRDYPVDEEEKQYQDIIPTYELMITKQKGAYYLNGGRKSLKEIYHTIGRILHLLDGAYSRGDVVTRTTIRELADRIISTPADISYALTNMVPFQFYHDGRLERVRLKLMAIGEESYAIEISSNLWGRISESNLVTYLNSYVHGSARGSWKNLSPRRLYTKLINREPSDSELKLMIAFLQQNRSADLVEKRAMSLLDDILEKYPNRVSRRINEVSKEIYIVVRGQVNDWLLRGNTADMNRISVGPQSVTTRQLRNNDVDNLLQWSGSICINTGGKSPSMGDQFATRIFSLLNDKLTIGRVSTISLIKPNYRIDNIHCPKVLTENMEMPIFPTEGISNTIKVNKDEVPGMSSE